MAWSKAARDAAIAARRAKAKGAAQHRQSVSKALANFGVLGQSGALRQQYGNIERAAAAQRRAKPKAKTGGSGGRAGQKAAQQAATYAAAKKASQQPGYGRGSGILPGRRGPRGTRWGQ